MEARLSLVTLGVADVARATALYMQFGFERAVASNENISFMKAGGVVLPLFGRRALAEDIGLSAESAGVAAPSGFAGVTLAHDVRCEAGVDAVLAEAVRAGGQVVKPGQKMFWGGYSGCFSDPDGHFWEVACNPFFRLDEWGQVQIDQSLTMFKKILIANRGENSRAAVVSTHCMARAACAGGFAAESRHV